MTGEGSEVEPIVLSRGVRTWLVGRRAIGFAVKTFPLSRAASTRQVGITYSSIILVPQKPTQ